MQPVFERLMAKLAQARLFKKQSAASGRRPPLRRRRTPPARRCVRSSSSIPAICPEALLCAGNCAELGPILRGEKDAVQVLFAGAGAELLEQFYGDGLLTSHWLAAIAAAVSEAARALPEGRGLRILEVGAGTGGLASQVLPLLERGLHSYTFTDVSAGFFSAAAQKLAAFPEVECKMFDLEKPGAEQGFDAGSFDFIIGTNVLHAVADVRATLRASARSARARRQPRLHGYRDAAALDRDGLRPDQRLVAFHRPRLAPRAAAAAARAMGASCCARPASRKPPRCPA